jgi:probable HAF family extracellular repeat protein
MKQHIQLLVSGLWLSASVAIAAPQNHHDYRLDALPGLAEPSIGVALKINARGQVAGWSLDGNGNPRAVLWQRQHKGGYRVLDLGTLGGPVSWAYGLNDRGEVVGAATIETGEEYAFLWRQGVMTNLGAFISAPPLPHGWRTLSQANAINNAGQIVGWSVADDVNTKAFIWDDGMMRELESLGPPADARAQAHDINDRGDVAGWSITGLGEAGAVLWHHGRALALGADAADAYAINARGQVAGMGQGPVDLGAFLWHRGTMIRAGVESSIAYGLSDSGHAVGSYLSLIDWTNGLFIESAFVWDGEIFKALPSPAPDRSSYAYSINNRGQVAGAIVGRDWFFNPVLWTKSHHGR